MTKTYLSLDWGAKRIGLAIGNGETKLAGPLGVVGGMSELLEIIKNERIDFLVIGHPVKMSGAQDNYTPGFEEFLTELKTKTDMPVVLFDERLTSKAADALSGTKKTKASRDALAAMVILQDYFDSLERLAN